MATPDTFDSTMDIWKAEQQTPWFRLRYAVVRRNLAGMLADAPQRILDVGGGNGYESLDFAMRGHHVTLIDYSPAMLADARARAEVARCVDRLVITEADVAALPSLFEPGSFDVVLCHNVLQYVRAPMLAVQHIAAVLRPGGIVSVVCPNRYGETYVHALLKNDPGTAFDLLDAAQMQATLFDVSVHRFTGAALAEMLHAAGCTDATEHGILCVCAYNPDNDSKYDPAYFEQLERLEHALSSRHPYNLVGRFTR